MESRIETDNLVLRILKPTEAALVAAFYSRNYYDFAKYEPLILKQAISIRYQRRALEYENRYRAEGSRVRYYMFEKYDPFRAIGTISFRDIDKDNKGSCIVGYKVDLDYRRRGYARETLATLIPVVERYYDLHRIEAEVMPGNLASQNLLASLDFHRTALLKNRIEIEHVKYDEYLYVRED